mmetsp:Transcript_74808/g.121557  ORF Transcript_74808/g.121557 Transcript_74808/m.121557 type:complete len:881 (+) Transcript_74808:52-2694(+)
MKMSFLLLLLLAATPSGCADMSEIAPYMELSWPPAGHALIEGESEMYCMMTLYNLQAHDITHTSYKIEILDSFSKRRVSGAGGPVEGQTEVQPDGSRILHINLQGLPKGRYAFSAAMSINGTAFSTYPWHTFRVQRSFLLRSQSPPPPAGVAVTFPLGTPGEAEREGDEAAHLVVGLVRLRNVARSVKPFLRALSAFTHNIVVLDDASVDGTSDLIQEVAKECRVARILGKGARDEIAADPWGDMQALLEEGRKIGGTHFVVLHSDEFLSTSWMDGTWWGVLRSLDVGESLSVQWIHFWKSLRYARADWMLQNRGLRSLRIVDIAFRDDASCSYLSNKAADSGLSAHSEDTRKFDLSRIPRDLDGLQVEISSQPHGLLHLGFVDWVAAMHRVHLRRLVTRLQLPDADREAVDGVLAHVIDEAGVHGVACSWQMFGNWSNYGVDVAAAFGLRASHVYAQVFANSRQLEDSSTVWEPLNALASDGNSCWQAQAAQMLLAEHTYLESVASACEGDVSLPQEARFRASPTFSVPSSFVADAHVDLMGTPVVHGVPKVCVLVSTKRPGGIDTILNSLALQTNQDFELVMVDELWEREANLRAKAAELGIHLTALSTSKPKANPLAFGFQNAWNTGLGSCRGPYIAIVNDYAWLAEEFVQSVIGFYEDVREDLPPVGERRLALLSFPIIQYNVPEDYLDRGKLFNNSLLSVFTHELKTPPRDLGWTESDPLGPYDTQHSTFKPHWFWDGQAMVVTRGAMEAVNGFDEVLDYGNDCHMQNIRDRVALLGGQVWLAPAKVLVQEIDHHNWFPKGETTEFLLYNRLPKDTNLDRWARLIGRIRDAAYSNRASNFGFDLSDYYQRQHDDEGEAAKACKWMSTKENWKCHI